MFFRAEWLIYEHMVCAVIDFAMSKYCSKLLQYFMNSQKLTQLSKLGFNFDRSSNGSYWFLGLFGERCAIRRLGAQGGDSGADQQMPSCALSLKADDLRIRHEICGVAERKAARHSVDVLWIVLSCVSPNSLIPRVRKHEFAEGCLPSLQRVLAW